MPRVSILTDEPPMIFNKKGTARCSSHPLQAERGETLIRSTQTKTPGNHPQRTPTEDVYSLRYDYSEFDINSKGLKRHTMLKVATKLLHILWFIYPLRSAVMQS
jgi:hypothetical protein